MPSQRHEVCFEYARLPSSEVVCKSDQLQLERDDIAPTAFPSNPESLVK